MSRSGLRTTLAVVSAVVTAFWAIVMCGIAVSVIAGALHYIPAVLLGLVVAAFAAEPAYHYRRHIEVLRRRDRKRWPMPTLDRPSVA